MGDQANKLINTRRLWCPAFMMAGISLLSGTAGVQLGSWSFVGIDKLGHLVVFGLLGISWARVLSGSSLERSHRFLLAVILTILFGFFDELHQLRNPLRTFEWADLLADGLGATIGAGIYLFSRFWQAAMELELRDALRLRFPRKLSNSP